MADTKEAYSVHSAIYTAVDARISSIDEARYKRAKARESTWNVVWKRNMVNINDIVAAFAPGTHETLRGIKLIFHGPSVDVIADMAAGYLRLRNRKTKDYLKLDGSPGNRDETHFKILRREEM